MAIPVVPCRSKLSNGKPSNGILISRPLSKKTAYLAFLAHCLSIVSTFLIATESTALTVVFIVKAAIARTDRCFFLRYSLYTVTPIAFNIPDYWIKVKDFRCHLPAQTTPKIRYSAAAMPENRANLQIFGIQIDADFLIL